VRIPGREVLAVEAEALATREMLGRFDAFGAGLGDVTALGASPATHVGYELIGAGMLLLAAGERGLPMDYDELERWTRVGYERGTRSRKGERSKVAAS
jgi:hypothetical protein